MGKLLIYKPIDILLELIRTMLYEYHSTAVYNRKIPKVNKRLGRIKYVFDNLPVD